MGRLASTVLAFVILGAASSALADFKTLQGSATYRQRIALQPGAVLEVELRDISRADAPAPLLSAVAVKPIGQVPIRFELTYDDNMIDERFTYAVSAKIRFGDRVVFRSTSAHLVLTRGNPSEVEVVMDMMPADDQTGAEMLYGGTWVAEDIGGGGVIDIAQSTVAFAPDGSASGSGGCNSFTGKATIDGNRISIGPLAATQRACVPALGDQEQKFFDALADARAFDIDERTRKLVLKDESGAPLATLALQ
jgi:putative lipoprotein